MNDRPKISVITSVYNDQAYLAQSIESILNQSESDFEFIIIDDGSTDNSLSIIESYQKKDSRIKLIRNNDNIGLTKSLNKGLHQAQGRYIARQDANDVSLTGRLAKQFNYLESHTDVFLCGSAISFIDDKGHLTPKKQKDYLFSVEGVARALSNQNCFVHSTIFFRNEGIEYREKFYYAQDYDFYLNLLSQNKKLVNLNEVLVHWRMDPKAISYRNRDKQILFAEKAKEFYQERIKNHSDSYDQFDPQMILNKESVETNNSVVIEDRLKNHLKQGEFKAAKRLYNSQYKRLEKKNNTTLFWLFVHLPIIYKLYRKLVYKDSWNEFKR